MPDKPNVIVVMCDHLWAHALGCCGNASCRTPDMDRLAAQEADA